MGPAAAVRVLRIHVDAEVLVDGGEHVLRALRIRLRVSTVRIRRADHATTLDRATRHHAAEHVRIVIAARVVVHLRRAAELAPSQHEGRVQKPAGIEVFHQGGEGPIPARQEAEPQRLEALHVRIPPAQIDRDNSHAGFHESASQQHALSPVRRAATVRCLRVELRHHPIAFANLLRLAVEVEGIPRLRRSQHVPRLHLEAVERVELAGTLDIATEFVEVLEQRFAVADVLVGESGGEREIGHFEGAALSGVGDGFKCLVRNAEIRRACAGRVFRDHDVGRHRRVLMADLLRDDGADTRVNVLVRGDAAVVTGEAYLVAGAVARVVVVQAAHDRPLVHELGGQGQHVGEADAGHAGSDGAELAAILDRCVGLRIPHVDVAGSAAHPQQQDRVQLRSGFLLFGSQYVAETQPGGTEKTGLHEASAARAHRLVKVFATDAIGRGRGHEMDSGGG